MTSGQTSPEDLQRLLLLANYAQRFSDFPQNFNWSIVFDVNREKPFNHNRIYSTAIATIILASLVVIGRFAVRLYRHEWGWDDYFMAATWIVAIGWGTLQILFVPIGGIGRHIWDIPYRNLQLLTQITHWDLTLYIVMAQLLRTSIFLYLRRVVPRSSRTIHTIIVWTLTFQIAFTVAAILLNHLSCRNPAALWSLDVRIRDFRCVSWTPLTLGISSVLTASDIWTFLVPMRIVWTFRLPKSSQVAAFIVFIIAGFAIAASLARLFYIAPSYNSWDSTWNGNGAILWVQFEGTFGIIAACLPIYNVFLTNYIPQWMKTSRLSPALRSLLGNSESSKDNDHKPPVPKLVPDEFSPPFTGAVQTGLIRPQDLESMQQDHFITGHDFFTDSEGQRSNEELSASDEKLYARYFSQTQQTRPNNAMVDRSAARRSWPATRGAVRTQHPYFAEISTEAASVHSFGGVETDETNTSVWVLQKP